MRWSPSEKMCANKTGVVQPRLIPSQLPCGLKYSSSSSGMPILLLWVTTIGISSTRSVVTFSCSAIQTAYRIFKILSPFDRTVSLNFQKTRSYSEVSNELLRITEKYKFPFKLRYHQATEREIRSTIAHYSSLLRPHQASPVPSSIDAEYYRQNAETGIDVDTFLKPYEHVDVILKSKTILIHR